jgi:hypothetical protein
LHSGYCGTPRYLCVSASDIHQFQESSATKLSAMPKPTKRGGTSASPETRDGEAAAEEEPIAGVDGEDGNNNSTLPRKEQREEAMQQALSRLDDQYLKMSEKRKILLQMLHKLQTEETGLLKASTLIQEQSRPTQKKRPPVKKRDEEAVQRLEQALLGAGGEQSDDSEEDLDSDNDSRIGIESMEL